MPSGPPPRSGHLAPCPIAPHVAPGVPVLVEPLEEGRAMPSRPLAAPDPRPMVWARQPSTRQPLPTLWAGPWAGAGRTEQPVHAGGRQWGCTGLTGLVLCAPGAAASLRGNGRRRLSVTSDRCLLGLAGTPRAPAAPALANWKGLLFRGRRRHRRKRKKKHK